MKYRFLKASGRFPEGAIPLDNVLLAPASLLAWKAQWQRIANSLPQGDILIVLSPLPRQTAILEQVAEELRKIGRNVTTMSAEALRELGAEPRQVEPAPPPRPSQAVPRRA
jgi:hypothetical protein